MPRGSHNTDAETRIQPARRRKDAELGLTTGINEADIMATAAIKVPIGKPPGRDRSRMASTPSTRVTRHPMVRRSKTVTVFKVSCCCAGKKNCLLLTVGIGFY